MIKIHETMNNYGRPNTTGLGSFFFLRAGGKNRTSDEMRKGNRADGEPPKITTKMIQSSQIRKKFKLFLSLASETQKGKKTWKALLIIIINLFVFLLATIGIKRKLFTATRLDKQEVNE